MQDELWRQWRSFAALWTPAGPGGNPGPSSESSLGFAPFIEAGERFKTAAQSFLEAAGGPAPAAAAAAQSFSDFLRDQFADARLPWNAAFAGGGSGEGAQQPSVADWPALGPMREHQQRWQRMAEAARRIDEAQRRLQRLWADALRQAAADFAVRMQPPLPSAADPQALRKLYDDWIDCAEDAYARTAHGEAFCTAQADLVNALSHWRRELRASIEHWSKLLDLPTRSEINTLEQRLKALETQLRAAASGARATGTARAARSSAAPKASAAHPQRARRKPRGKPGRKAGR
ncbi:MAG: poly(R)-hydroxyalkanoic acid synthase subunit PhaE [Steroidobacterales bacterium]